MQLSIIIVNYNVKYFLEQCLYSVQAAIKNIDAEVWVVDNHSSDSSAEFLQKNFHWIKLIENKTNSGFAKANNLALQQCSGDYILFLNPDTIITENILEHCLGHFKENKNTGAVGVRMIDGNGKFLPESKRAFPSPMISFWKLTGMAALFPRSKFFNRYALGYLSEHKMHKVDVLCGAFLMAPKNLLLHINGFDEDFFMYGEDIDLSYRIRRQGMEICYLGTGTIIHFKGESSGTDKRKHLHNFYKAMSVFVRKHYRGSNAWMMNLLLHAGIYARAALSFIAAPFRFLLHRFFLRRKVNGYSFLLIGDESSIEEAAAIISYNRMAATIKKSITDFEQAIAQSDENIIFCIGESFCYTQSIALMQQHAGKNYKWHALNSKSIAGSMYKNMTGEVIGAKD